MTIDEAIKHAKDKAKEQRKDYDTCVVKEGYGCKDCAYYYSKSCIECAEEHEQLAEWLEELKCYRNDNDFSEYADRLYKVAYKKAIDDFVKNIKKCSGWTPNCIESWHDVCLTIYTLYQIAEELKKECAE